MKQTILILNVFLLTTFNGWTQNNKTTIAYIELYKGIAMKEMKRTGVPASITLAQAIVESNSGESNLAKNYNNHFGIKCKSDWTGAKAYQDDDAKQECFRAYETAEQSFKDHSNFLKSRPNYADLFLLDPVDDTAWAFGLKKAGYATAADYPKKLLKIIDDYELAQYNFPELANEIEEEEEAVKTASDTPVIKTLADAPLIKTASDTPVNKTLNDTPVNKVLADTPKSLNKPAGIVQLNTSSATPLAPTKQLSAAIKEDELKKDTLTAIQVIQKEVPTIAQNDKIIEHPIHQPIEPSYNYPEGRFRVNQVPAILGKKNRSYIEIAIEYNLPLHKLFEYNEIEASILLDRDQLIFLAQKKKEGRQPFHIAKYNTTLHEISQLEGIQWSQLKLYNPNLNENIKEGTQVQLIKAKENTTTTIKKDNSLLFNKKNKK